MKKKNVIVMMWICVLYLAFLGILTGCGGQAEGERPERMTYNEINYFHYNYGSFHEGYWSFTIYTDGDDVFLTAKGSNGVEMNLDRQEIPKSTLDELAELIQEYGIESWDGFEGNDPDVLDGYDFVLQVGLSSQEQYAVDARGYMLTPDNYWQVHDVLSEYLLTLTAAYE